MRWSLILLVGDHAEVDALPRGDDNLPGEPRQQLRQSFEVDSLACSAGVLVNLRQKPGEAVGLAARVLDAGFDGGLGTIGDLARPALGVGEGAVVVFLGLGNRLTAVPA